MGARRIIRVQPSVPLGDVTVVPAALSGRTEADSTRALAEAIAEFDIPSASDVLGRLRRAFPLARLSRRLAGLRLVIERSRRPGRGIRYRPR